LKAVLSAICELAKHGKIGISRPSSAALGVWTPLPALLASVAIRF
jgi:hypothetical protein